MPGREQAERVDEMRRELGQELERGYQNQVGRGMTITGNELVDDSIAVQAAKEVDSQRREIDEEIVERMKERQRYFYEKAQMYREAADLYTRMAEDIAELLNNDYVNSGQKKAMS